MKLDMTQADAQLVIRAIQEQANRLIAQIAYAAKMEQEQRQQAEKERADEKPTD